MDLCRWSKFYQPVAGRLQPVLAGQFQRRSWRQPDDLWNQHRVLPIRRISDLPKISVTGFNQLGGSDSPLYTTPNQTYIYSDSASYLWRAHTLRFGGEIRTGMTNNRRDTGGKGVIDFDTSYDDEREPAAEPTRKLHPGVANYGYVFIGDSHRVVSQASFGMFLQDSWRVRNNLTISWGLRYDLTLPIHEKHDLLGNFDPTAGLVQVGKQISAPYNTDHHDLGPRLAFIWDPRGDGRTVVRAGGGVIYEIPHISVYIGQNGTAANGLSVIPTGAAGVTPGGGSIVATTYYYNSDYTTNTNQTLTNGWQSGGPVFGNLSPSLISCSYDNPCPIMGVNHGITTPYIFNWNLNVEQALWRNAAATIAYVANKGVQLYSIRDINQNIYANDVLAMGSPAAPMWVHFPTWVLSTCWATVITRCTTPAADLKTTDGAWIVFSCRLYLGARH